VKIDNFEIINKAFLVILPSLAEFVGSTLKEKDNKNWWKNYVISKLPEASIRNLPKEGSYEEYIKSLDILACLNIIIANYYDTFNNKFKYRRFFTYAHEIRDVRNEYYAHIATRTLGTFNNENLKHALDTMALFMNSIDPIISEELYLLKSQIESTETLKTANPGIKPTTLPNTEGIKFVDKCVIIKTKEEIIKERGGLYAAVRCFWHSKKEKAEKADYVLAVVRGKGKYIVENVFKPTAWYDATDENMKKYGVKDYYRENEHKGRIFFVGEEADEEIKNCYKKPLPDNFKCQCSFQYTWNQSDK